MTIVAKNSLTLSNINDGTITHTAYAYSADGTDRFTTVYPNLNLLHNWDSDRDWKSYTFSSWDAKIADASLESLGLKVGDTITYSAEIDNTSGSIGARIVLFGIDSNGKPTFGINSNIIAIGSSGKSFITAVIPANTVNLRYSNVSKVDNSTQTTLNARRQKLEPGSTVTPYMQSASEVTTADWPSYIGQYTDFTQADSTKPSDYTWSLIRGNDGKDGANGKDGIAGKDGVGIKTTVITYAISTSGTTAPTAGWTSSVPGLVKGQYLWTKTVWTYTDSSSETGYSVTYIAKDGNNGNDGIAGKDGVGIKTTTITYASHTNGTTAPTTGYTTTVPSVPAGQFLWTKTVWTYTDNSSETGYSVAMMGLKGDKGDPGNNGTNGIAGKDGKGIKATAITYQANTNGTTAPTGTWSASVPPVAKGSFLWTRTIWTYTDNTTETGYAVAYMGTNGNNGNDGIAGKDGVGIKTTTITYAGSTSGTTAPTSGWTTTVPTVAAGSYLWTKTVWTYTDNTSETGYSVAKMGNTGPTGPAGAPGSNGNPGKIVSDTEPTTRFKGLTWKYLGTSDLTASDGTVILSGTEYYWSGTNWILSEINAHNINGNNLTITDGEFSSTIINGSVQIQTEIKDDHLLIYKMDTSHNEIHTIALKSDSGLGMTYQNSDTGEYTSAGVNFQGLFMQNNITNEFARLTPQGTKLSTDVPWITLSTTNGFSGGSFQFSIQNGVEFFSIAGLGVPNMNAMQWYQVTSLPAGSKAIPSINRVYPISGNNNAWDLLINAAGGVFIRCQAAVSATSNLVNGGCGFPIG